MNILRFWAFPDVLVYAMAPVAGVFIVLAQVINLYEDVTGNVIEEGEEA